jgi:hypothetical protein
MQKICGPGGAVDSIGSASSGRNERWGSRGLPVGARDEEGDEVTLRGCSPEHGQRWRGGAMEAKSSGGLSSARRRSGARGSSGEREIRGWCSPFIWAGGAREAVAGE